MDKELLLWQWSTTAQITSALLIAVFFIVLARSMRRVEMRTWVQAWLTNLAALEEEPPPALHVGAGGEARCSAAVYRVAPR